jgi:hypothetical protein
MKYRTGTWAGSAGRRLAIKEIFRNAQTAGDDPGTTVTKKRRQTNQNGRRHRNDDRAVELCRSCIAVLKTVYDRFSNYLSKKLFSL